MAAAAQRVFPVGLYSEAGVEDAVEAFAELAKIEVTKDDAGWTLVLTDVDEDFEPEELASELANYVLASTIDRRRS